MVKSLDAGDKGYVTIDDFKGLYDVLEAMQFWAALLHWKR